MSVETIVLVERLLHDSDAHKKTWGKKARLALTLIIGFGIALLSSPVPRIIIGDRHRLELRKPTITLGVQRMQPTRAMYFLEPVRSMQPVLPPRAWRSTARVRATTWRELEQQLPATSAKSEPLLTLYRDTNGWCPFCERVMLALREKGMAYDEKLVDLRNKPKWYTDIVPTKLVPAIKVHGTDEVIWESLDILKYLDEHFPDTHPLMGSEAGVSEALARNEALLSAGFRFAYGNRNASLSADEKQQRRDAFFAAMDAVDAAVMEGGPFLAGPSLTVADVCLIPMMERYRWQLPFTAGLSIYDGARWPGFKRWFDAMDGLPSYRDHVAGDEVSWTLVTSTFLRLFASGANGTLSDETKATIEKADHAALTLLARAEADAASAMAEAPREAVIEAATKLIHNHDAVVADAAAGDDTEPKSQRTLNRLPRDAAPVVEHVLRNAASRLLGLAPEPIPLATAATAAQAARFIAQRLCAPRDMGATAAKALRAALFQEATAAEAVAVPAEAVAR